MERPERAMVVKAVMEAAIITAAWRSLVLLALKVKMARMPPFYMVVAVELEAADPVAVVGGSAAGPYGNVNTPGQVGAAGAGPGKAETARPVA